MGHVVHVRPVRARNGWLGVGVQFDCYEVVEREGKSETGNWKMEKGKDKLEIRN
jgi:hypothetical protein